MFDRFLDTSGTLVSVSEIELEPVSVGPELDGSLQAANGRVGPSFQVTEKPPLKTGQARSAERGNVTGTDGRASRQPCSITRTKRRPRPG
ncbi:MAG TPA: hypothetical protein VKG78_10530, partial [Opitutaceae bacterium]|nr:hypothetical protein [Opitutaceae bacterium]